MTDLEKQEDRLQQGIEEAVAEEPITAPSVEIVGEEDQTAIPRELAILPLRGVVVYPVTFQALSVGQPRSIRLVDDATVHKQLIGLVTSRDADKEEPGPEDVYPSAWLLRSTA
jgi:ATP-dependent Lon protease